MSRSYSASILLTATCGLLLCGATGCTSLVTSLEVPGFAKHTPKVPEEVNGPHYFIEIFVDSNKPQATKVPCIDPRSATEGHSTVQDAMDIARHNGSGVEVMVLRANGQQKMNVRFNEKGKVRMNYDYVLYPGDHVQIMPEDENKGKSALDKWSDSLVSQLLPGVRK